jgi:hypothetical protein
MPGSEPIEIVLGANQPEYTPLPAVYLNRHDVPMITRWQLDEGERAAIAAGADIVLQQLTFGQHFQPVNLQVVLPSACPVFVEENL